jgi:hypothetical protein
MENIKNIPKNIYLQVDSDGDDSEIEKENDIQNKYL